MLVVYSYGAEALGWVPPAHPDKSGYSLAAVLAVGENSHVNSTPVHDDVMKGKHFLRYWPFVRGIHRSRVDSPYKASNTEL